MLGMLHPYQLLRRHQMVLLFSFFLILDYFVWVGSENFLQFPGFDLMVGFPSGQFGNPTNPWWNFHPLDGFPSRGWNWSDLQPHGWKSNNCNALGLVGPGVAIRSPLLRFCLTRIVLDLVLVLENKGTVGFRCELIVIWAL